MKDPTEFRQRFAAWKNGDKVYDCGKALPKYDTGIGKKLDNRSFVLNVFHDDKSMYDSLTENGYPEQAADQYTKDIEDYRLGLSNDDISGYDGGELREVVVTPQNGLILPEVEAVPYNLTLDTYYPWSESYRGVGHSSLHGNHGHRISVASDDPGYNLVFNNCSDATRTALEAVTGNKIDPWFFTTPGDVQQFFKEQFPDYKTEYSKGGKTTLSAVVTKDQYDKFLHIADSLNLLRKSFMYDKGKSIHINPANKGKFNATKKRTGKTTEQLAHSKNPLTRKRAIFALNSRKWRH